MYCRELRMNYSIGMRLNAITSLHFILLLLLFHPSFSWPKTGLRNLITHTLNAAPQQYIEVSKPIIPKKDNNPCSVLVLQHDFANTYGKPAVEVPYKPPVHCPLKWNKVVLQWKASCKGEQYDRIAGVWLSGAEILRTSTAEPTEAGISWEVSKDITKYSSLLKQPQSVQVMLENLVDSTYTGIYHVNISFLFYQIHGPSPETADLILPISDPIGNHGHWFRLLKTPNFESKQVKMPLNAYRAVLEIYVSSHENDEFWYSNPPDAYIEANNLTTRRGNGAFREVVAFIDGVVVGSVWPFPVVFTGGINPLFWAPVVGIGAFNLPTYDLEVTPFVGKLLDGKQHSIGLGVTDGIAVWLVDANLHLWLDERRPYTKGMLTDYQAPDFQPKRIYEFEGLDGSFQTYGERRIDFSGWVESSLGNLTTSVFQTFKYSNMISYENKGDTIKVELKTETNRKLTVKTVSELVMSRTMSSSYPLLMRSASVDKENGSYLATTNLSHAFNEDIINAFPSGSSFCSLKNFQDSQGSMLVKDHSVLNGTASTQQTYKYSGRNGCYFRTLSIKDSKFIKDHSDTFCKYYS